MKPPPEEKLLRLIRGRAARPSSGTASGEAASGPPQEAGQSAASPLAAEAPARLRNLPWLRVAIGLLGALLCLEVAVLLVQALWPLPPAAMPAVATPSRPEATSAGTPPIPSPEELPSVAASASRALFAPPAPAAPAQALPSGSARQLASRLTLMGIVAGEPAQAIIEDSQTQKTYFVTPGQMVVEGAVVEQVLDNRVVLDLAGEKIELTL